MLLLIVEVLSLPLKEVVIEVCILKLLSVVEVIEGVMTN